MNNGDLDHIYLGLGCTIYVDDAGINLASCFSIGLSRRRRADLTTLTNSPGFCDLKGATQPFQYHTYK